MTAIQIVQEIASTFGHTVDENSADYIAFEHTGFPAFWNIPKDGATPEECFRKQLKTYFEKLKK